MTRARQRRVRPDDPQAPQGGDRRARSTSCSEVVGLDGYAGPLPVAAVRRPAPAHGARPRAGRRAARAAARRAVRRAGREGPRGAARAGCAACTTRSTSPRCWSPTTRRRRWTSPTAIAVLSHGPDRAGRRAARALRAARRRLRDGLPRAGGPSSATRSCARTTCTSALEARAGDVEAMVAPRRAPRLRGPRGARARATAARSTAQVTRGEADALELRRGRHRARARGGR